MAVIAWQKDTEEKFKQLVEKVPVFLRSIAQDKVAKKAEDIAKRDSRSEIGEKDLVDAFFTETPYGFHGPMKTDMESVGIDYTKYGYKR